MKWTKKKPTKTGIYWYQPKKHGQRCLIEVVLYKTTVRLYGSWADYVKPKDAKIHEYSLENIKGGYWSDIPITPPKE